MKYVALLRGINVGGNKKVDMKELKTVFESLGFQGVLTYINSGNVIFEADNPERKEIEKVIEDHFGFHVPTILRNEKQIKQTHERIPIEWENNKDMKTDILFLGDEFDTPEVLGLIEQNSEADTLIYTPGAVIWHIDKRFYNQSKIHKFITSKIYRHMTARNINTVRKIDALLK